jgi:hypothetical protein
MRFPKISEVAQELRSVNEMESHPDEEGNYWIDVRLQVYSDGDWAVRWGDSSYDQDHRGYWGASSVPGGGRRFNSTDLARDLIDQAKDQHAMTPPKPRPQRRTLIESRKSRRWALALK